MHVKDPSKPLHLKSQVIQLERMEQKLADAQDLNDLYIDNNLELQSQFSEKDMEVQRLLIVQNREQDELIKVRDQKKAQNKKKQISNNRFESSPKKQWCNKRNSSS